jgi:glycerol kinase
MGFQVRDVVEAMAASPTAPSVLRVDGGASAMDLLLELVAEQTQLRVLRPRSVETTAIGAATLAGLAEGVWGSMDELAGLWVEDRAFDATGTGEDAGPARQAWLRAVERSRRWAPEATEAEVPEAGDPDERDD